MAVKLDTGKVYDWVEWDFLRNMLLKLGFQTDSVGLVMSHVGSLSSSVLVNGSPTHSFRLSRGVW